MTHSQPKTEKRLFTEQQAADYLGMSRSYLRQDRMNGPQFKNSQDSEFCRPLGRPQGRRTGCTSDNNRTPGPDYCRFGTMIRYTKEALDKWIDDNLITRVND